MSGKKKRSTGRKRKPVQQTQSANPIAIADQLITQLGDVALPGHPDAFAAAILQRYDNVLRFRRDATAEAFPVQSHPLPWYRLAYRAAEDGEAKRIRFSRTLDYAAGDYFLQDAGSLLALAAAGADTDALAGKLVCDLCAAPGGKASALAEAISAAGKPGFLLANEPIRSRLGPLKFNLARTGTDRYAISQLDPDDLAERLPGIFDLVLVDAPCSGQALVGRGKQKLASLSTKQVEHSAARQQRILHAATRLLKPGGRLIYSTCTFAEAENEAQVHFLVNQSNLVVDPVERLTAYQSAKGCYRLWPHENDCAGGFTASLKLAEAANRDQPPSFASSTGDRQLDPSRLERAVAEALSWVESTFCLDRSQARLFLADVVLNIWPADAPPWVESVAAAGPELAYRTHQVWKPAHNAALIRSDRAVGRPAQNLALDDDQAAAFLRGETVNCSEVGWCCIRHHGRPLGWVKSDGERGKNQLPAAARMEIHRE